MKLIFLKNVSYKIAWGRLFSFAMNKAQKVGQRSSKQASRHKSKSLQTGFIN